jgi:GNAT superfamily N-acetyltransferase
MRVGLAAGKALSQALRVPMIGIPSLDLLAFTCRHVDRVIVPVIDARKNEVFWAMYRPVPGGVQQVSPPTVGPVDDLVGDLLARSQDVLCIGDGAERYRDEITEGFRCEISGPMYPSVGCSCCSPTPAPCARRGYVPTRSSRSICGPPMRRSTGPSEGHDHECVVATADAVRRRPAGAVTIEPFQIRHLREVLPIEQNAYPKPWSRGVFESELRQVSTAVATTSSPATARVAGRVVGYAGLWFVHEPDGDQAHVTNIVVAPDSRRLGVGAQLMTTLARTAIERGCVAWTLEVRAPIRPLRSSIASSDSLRRACASATTRTPRTRS